MPYLNEHAARLRDPEDFDPDSFRRTSGSGEANVGNGPVPETIDVIWGKLKGATAPTDPPIAQALRFPVGKWTVEAAQAWLREHELEPEAFEPAETEERADAVTLTREVLRFAAPEPLKLEPKGSTPGRRRFKMVGNSGRPFQHLFGTTVVDLASLVAGERVPVLLNHDDNKIAGYATARRVTERGLELEGELSAHTDAAAEVAKLSDEGFPWQASVGLLPAELRDVPAGRSLEVNGRQVEGPATILTGCRMTEVSFVPAGADSLTEALALIALRSPVSCRRPAPEEVPVNKTDTPAAPAPASEPAAPAPVAPVAPVAPAPDPVALERARSAAITQEAVALGLAEEASRLVAAGTSVVDARVELRDLKLKRLQAAAPAPVGATTEPATVDASLPIPERAKVEFSSRPDLREEFLTLGAYEAYLRAEARDAVKLFRKVTDMSAASARRAT
jgi:hypothetical protein